MPSQPPPQVGQKRYPIQWVHIDDFSPGCYDGSNISTEEPTLTTVPLGAADITGTFACSVIKGGALGPLPAIIGGFPYSDFDGLPGTSPYSLVAGFIVTPQLDDGNYEVVVIFESDDGTDHYVTAWSFEPAFSVNAIVGPTITSDTTPGFFGAPYPAFTRMNLGGTPGPPPPPPMLVFPTAVLTDANGSSGHLWIYPDPSAPTTFVAVDLNAGPTSIVGQLITYGNRVICMCGINYDWPAGGGVNTNENFNYTDPPESFDYQDQQTIFAVEAPWGYGAWGTMSVGELFLVKKYGGAVILNGDINVPSSIIRLPGVQSTGNFVGRAASTPIGLIYCAQNQGAWLWNGGNTAEKISGNINDSFFDLETGMLTSSNYGFYVEHWQKWIVFSGNVWYDTETNSWWNIYPKKGTTIGTLVGSDFWWHCLTNNGSQLLAAPLTIDDNSDSVFSVLDNTVPSQTYQWQSLPIHVEPNADRVIDIRQVVIRASDPSNSGQATIELKLPNGTFDETTTPGDINPTPTPLRFNVGQGAQGLEDIVLQIIATNGVSSSAPIIHSIDVGYIVRAGVAVID